MKKITVASAAVVILAAVGGGGYYYVKYQMVSQYIHELEEKNPGLTIKYASNSINVFDKSATFNNVVVTDKDGNSYQAKTLSFSIAMDHVLPSLSIEQFKGNVGGYPINIAHLDAKNITSPSKDGDQNIVINDKFKLPFAAFDQINLKDLNVQFPRNNTLNIASYHIEHFGLNQKTNQTFEGIHFAGNSSNYDVKQLKWDGFNFANLIPVVATAYPQLRGDLPVRDKLHVLGNIVEKVNFDLFSFSDYVGQSKNVNSSIGKYELKNWGMNRISSGLCENLKLNVASGFIAGGISVDNLAAEGGDSVKLFSMLLKGKIDTSDDVVRIINQYQQDLIKNKQLNSSIEMNGFALNILGITSSISKMHGQSKLIDDNYLDQNIALDDLSIPVVPYGKFFKGLNAIGYSKLQMSFDTKAKYNFAQEQLDGVIIAQLKDMGAINATIKYNTPFNCKTGVSPEEQMKQFKIISSTMDVHLQDLLQHIIHVTAKQLNMSEDQTKQYLNDLIAKQLPVTSSIDQEILTAIQKILQNPSEHLIIDINPTQPVSAYDLMKEKDNKQKIVEMLNIHITTK